MPRTLLTFRHGLGDAAQLTIVCQHLRHYDAGGQVDVLSSRGKHSLFRGVANHSFSSDDDVIEPGKYDRVLDLDWPENPHGYGDSPSTKAYLCVREVLRVAPLPFRYQIAIGEPARRRAAAYAASLPGEYVILHYQGNTDTRNKDLSHETAEELCRLLLENGLTPVILDWDRRSPLPDGRAIFCPDADHPLWLGYGTGDGETLAALIERARCFIGIDSGPLHVAMSTKTPTLAVWTEHHPVHYADLADDTLHLVPNHHARLVRGGAPAIAYFERNYRYKTYHSLEEGLLQAARRQLSLPPPKRNPMLAAELLHSHSFDRDYYDEHVSAGIDYLDFGDWQVRYAGWLVESLAMQGRRVLDVGCACGSIARALGERADAVGIDVNNHMIRLGREKFGELPLFVCDTVNLHLFADAEFDLVHSNQAAEHFRPELVPFILREWWRVLKPGGLAFCVLDTAELFQRQSRSLDRDDPTHTCVFPLAWWHEQLAAVGFEDARGEFEPRLRDHTDSYISLYDWDWWLFRKPTAAAGDESAAQSTLTCGSTLS